MSVPWLTLTCAGGDETTSARKRRLKTEVLPSSSREGDQTGVAILRDAVRTGRTVCVKNHQPCCQTNAALRPDIRLSCPTHASSSVLRGDTLRGASVNPCQIRERQGHPVKGKNGCLLMDTSCSRCCARHRENVAMQQKEAEELCRSDWSRPLCSRLTTEQETVPPFGDVLGVCLRRA